MKSAEILRSARKRAHLTTDELARRAATSRTAVSAYENGHKSPTIATFDRLIAATGQQVVLDDKPVQFTTIFTRRGRPLSVPDRIPRLLLKDALRTTALPARTHWSGPPREYNLADRRERALVYRAVMTEGTEQDLLDFIDGALLVDMWDDLRLPREVRDAWQPLIDDALRVDRG
ncbi:Helix-turn-helix [Sanguibacter gelidistatuariae]|uniref:Helix-turn-helix n=2 Tax=Sanguibacter gelidistatuariae TaxID=1814289 RepID=A0A1G6S4B9_9MICO|nr:Helix-turn-helix [Sanguibacter gelidistatuariae]